MLQVHGENEATDGNPLKLTDDRARGWEMLLASHYERW